MSRLADIAIRVEAGVAAATVEAPGATPARRGGLGGGVAAVLSELAGMLDKVAGGGAAATIDVRSLPMSAEDRVELQLALGQGEVHATLTAEGASTLQETAVSGVWWVQHRDRHGDLIAELIEVAAIPGILEASAEDMAAGARELRDRTTHAISG